MFLTKKEEEGRITQKGEKEEEYGASPWPLPPQGEINPAQLSYCPKAFVLIYSSLFCYCFGVGMEMQSNFK